MCLLPPLPVPSTPKEADKLPKAGEGPLISSLLYSLIPSLIHSTNIQEPSRMNQDSPLPFPAKLSMGEPYPYADH